MARMCRKGAGWDFPRGVRIDPRMHDAEYTIDKEKEVQDLKDVLLQIVNDLPANRRPASLIAYHVALRDAYKQFEEPADGTPWTEIKIAHKCLESSWWETYSEPSTFELTDEFEGAWMGTFGELDKCDVHVKSLQTSPPPDHVMNEICGIFPIFDMLSRYSEAEMANEGMHFGKWFQDERKKRCESNADDPDDG